VRIERNSFNFFFFGGIFRESCSEVIPTQIDVIMGKKGKRSIKQKKKEERINTDMKYLFTSMSQKSDPDVTSKMIEDLETFESLFKLTNFDFKDSEQKYLAWMISESNKFRRIDMHVNLFGKLPSKSVLMETFAEEGRPIHTNEQYDEALEYYPVTNETILSKGHEWCGLFVHERETDDRVGFIIYRLKYAGDLPLCHIEHMCVHKDFQGRRYGSAMMIRMDFFLKFFLLHRSDIVVSVRATKNTEGFWRDRHFRLPEEFDEFPVDFTDQDIFEINGEVLLCRYADPYIKARFN